MKFESLKDGTHVTLREPTLDDVETVCRFAVALPPEDRKYLRFDLGKREVVEMLLHRAESDRTHRLIAVVGDEIVGHGALYISQDTWQRHLGEIRVLIAQNYRNRKLGTFLIRHLFEEAEKRGVERVLAKIAEPQIGARKIFEHLGFVVDAVMPNHVKDAEGGLHPMVVMSCSLDEVTRALRDFYRDDNWPDG